MRQAIEAIKRIAFAIALYFAVVCLLHGTALAALSSLGRVAFSDLIDLAVSLPILSVVMVLESPWVAAATGIGALLLLLAAMLFRRRYAWLLITASLIVLQFGGVLGVAVMGSV